MLRMQDSPPRPSSGTVKTPDKENKTAPATAATEAPAEPPAPGKARDQRVLTWVRNMINRGKSETTLREALDEFIGNAEENGAPTTDAGHERALIYNVAKLRDMTVLDVMIPRADIIALDIGTSQKELLSLLSEKQFSRLPIYRETLDDVIGTIHIKDILATLARGKQIDIKELVRDAPIVSPSMPVLDLILMMKQQRKHMALVVDEYGGIDGLVTIGDVIEAIIGEVDDEYNSDEELHLFESQHGVVADGRIDIDTFEKKYGVFLNDDEREDIDTIGGLIFSMSGRIPARGEILSHRSGLVFEILDADPRRVNRVLIKNIPLPAV